MTARQVFKTKGVMAPIGKVLVFSKGGYRDDNFAYCICDDGKQYNIKVLSAVNPREYSVSYGPKTTIETLENAILYNEWHARVVANLNKGGTI